MNYNEFKSEILSIIHSYTTTEGDENHKINFIRLIFPTDAEKIDLEKPIYFKDGLIEAIKDFLFKHDEYNIRVAHHGPLFWKRAVKKLCVGLHHTDVVPHKKNEKK